MKSFPSTVFVFVVVAGGLGAFAGPACALDEDVIGINTFASERYDSNLFRLQDDASPFSGDRRSAETRTAGVGLALNKAYGLQQFTLSGNISRVTYHPYAYLDSTPKSIHGSFAWTLTPSLTGNLSIDRSETPNNFSDTGVQRGPNLRKVDDRRLDIDYRPGAALHPRLSLLSDEDRSQQITFNRQNSKTTSVQGGLVYEFRSGNTTELYFRRGRGNYVNVDADASLQNDSQYLESETGLRAHYGASGFSAFDGQLGYLSREHRTFESRNFKGPVGQLTYTYFATGKTQVQFQATRTLSSVQTNVSSYSSDTTLAITPTWNATSKIAVRPSYAVTRRSFRGALVPVGDNLTMTMRDLNLYVDWNVYRTLTFTFALTKENRTSNDRTFQYSDHGALLQAALRF